jgi:hypothetical protein
MVRLSEPTSGADGRPLVIVLRYVVEGWKSVSAV